MQRWRELTADEEVAAVTALRELAGGRADLLAEVADLEEGALEGEPDEPLARQAARPGLTSRQSRMGRDRPRAEGKRQPAGSGVVLMPERVPCTPAV